MTQMGGLFLGIEQYLRCILLYVFHREKYFIPASNISFPQY